MSTVVLSKPGTLIHARGREWMVLPESTEELLIARPVGGLDEEITGILTGIEPVKSTTFPLPTAGDIGDFSSGLLLRDAARLSTRAAAGPFRSFGRIATEPRPYQLVPLMMALKLDVVRLLIADDVGVGKTIEASLIARELLDRGEISKLTVLCPPHLAEQWRRELLEKFHIDAQLILSSTIRRLERDLPLGVSVFDRHSFTIVSTDFIKGPRRADDFIRKCPEFVIVDEAHGCTLSSGVGRGYQQRFNLLKQIATDKQRHLLLVTATPHSGNEEAFRSLLSLLNQKFADLPHDLEKSEREGIRRQLARHLVQRRRADIGHYLGTDTIFPKRKDKETTYCFSEEYRSFFNDIESFATDYASSDGDGQRGRRVRYWSALALLRCVSSSPAAAVATLNRRAPADEATDKDVDEVGRRAVLDQDDDDDAITLDFNLGSDTEAGASSDTTRAKLRKFARRAEALSTDADNKLQGAIREIEALLRDGFHPVVFCRFVDTADYVARHLREVLSPKVHIQSVTGLLPPAEREDRINRLAEESGEYILVCTDCLSEGINLQQHFNAVLHYDLAWNPTRHEQREGRVDRFGQNEPEVRVITYYGDDNKIDTTILNVLIRKHKSIKSDLGVAVAVPGSNEKIIEALFGGLLLRKQANANLRQMAFAFSDNIESEMRKIHNEWENARDREKASRSRFAQHTLNPKHVTAELSSVREAIGSKEDVARFFHTTLQAANVSVKTKAQGITVHINDEVPRALRQAIDRDESFSGRFDLPLEDREIYLGRTSPIIEGLASWTIDQALDPNTWGNRPVASRCGVISTSDVTLRTTVLVARCRYHLQIGGAGAETEIILCEEVVPLACTGLSDDPTWLTPAVNKQLLEARPETNLVKTIIDQQIELLIKCLPSLQSALEPVAHERANMQLETHKRVRESTRLKSRVSVEPVLPVDILGAYVLLPKRD